MDLYYKQEVGVGVLVMVGITVLFAGLVFLNNVGVGGGRVAVPVRFVSVSGLTKGDLVLLSGVEVGRVAGITLQEEGNVLVTLDIDARRRPLMGATAAARSSGFLGDMYIEYSPGSGREVNDTIVGSSESGLTDLASGLSDDAVEVMVGLQRMMSEQMAQDLHEVLASTRQAMDAVAELGGGPLAGQLQASLASLERIGNRLDSTLANPGLQETLSQLDETTELAGDMLQGFTGVSQAIQNLLVQVADTSGSLGKLMASDTLHTDLHELLVSLRLLLDDVRERPGRYTVVKVF